MLLLRVCQLRLQIADGSALLLGGGQLRLQIIDVGQQGVLHYRETSNVDAAASASETSLGNISDAGLATDDDVGYGYAGGFSFSDSEGETLASAAAEGDSEPAPALPAVLARLRRSLAANEATIATGDSDVEWTGPSHVIHTAQPAAAPEVDDDDSLSTAGVDKADDGDIDAELESIDNEKGRSESDQQWSCVSLAGFLASNSLSDRAGQQLLDLLLDPKFTMDGIMATIGALKASAELIVGLCNDKDESLTLLTKHAIDLNQLGLGEPVYGLHQPVHFYLRNVQQAMQDILQRCSLEDGFAPRFVEQHDADGNRLYGESHTCDQWRAAEDDLRRQGRLQGDAVMVALLAYSDKTMSRSVGNVAFWPMMITILNLPRAVRHRPQCKALLGYIPVLKRPAFLRKLDSNAGPVKQFGLGQARIANACWGKVLTKLVDMERVMPDPAIKFTLKDGSTISGVPRVILFAGDHPESQMVCGMKGAWNASRPCRMCLVPFDHTDRYYRSTEQRGKGEICEPRVVQRVYAEVTEARQLPATRQAQAHVIGGYLGIITAFMVYAGFATVFGVFAATPQDKLHHFKGGLAADLLEYIISSLEKCTLRCGTASKALELWTARLQSLARYSDPQEGRTYRHFTGDILNCVQLASGVVLQLVFQLRYALGEVADVFEPPVHKAVMSTLLQFYDVYLAMDLPTAFTDAMLSDLEDKLERYLTTVNRVFGPGSALNHNMCKPKHHACSHLVQWIRQHGIPENFSTEHMEASHKEHTKDAAAKTNNHSDKERQMVRRDTHRSALESWLTGHEAARAAGPPRAESADVERIKSRMVPPVGRGCRLSALDAACVLPPNVLGYLHTCMAHAVGEDFDQSDLRMHTSYRQLSILGEEKSLIMSLQCRDTWRGGGGRKDDIVVKVAGDGPLYEFTLAYAQLVALLSYQKQQFAFIRWYFDAHRQADHIVTIAPRYLQNKPLRESLQVIDVSSISARAHIIQDRQFSSNIAGEKRFFVHDTNAKLL
ncbi:hypothetical protein JKP88DRAFT_247107 [Tribonema minus]|uniref:Uncharacterized protein n=1 Tax=Tribonema minus TaxID=303371 RepID=A0A835YTZ6_9STRA|nr:hypothetical protein JKP88DRAFT_247107 [Tribonema minus]